MDTAAINNMDKASKNKVTNHWSPFLLGVLKHIFQIFSFFLLKKIRNFLITKFYLLKNNAEKAFLNILTTLVFMICWD